MYNNKPTIVLTSNLTLLIYSTLTILIILLTWEPTIVLSWPSRLGSWFYLIEVKFFPQYYPVLNFRYQSFHLIDYSARNVQYLVKTLHENYNESTLSNIAITAHFAHKHKLLRERGRNFGIAQRLKRKTKFKRIIR